MNTDIFYGLVAVTCFTLVGLWWTVVQSRQDWLKDNSLRRIAGGIYLSLLLPGVMSLLAEIGGTDKVFWRVIFGLSGLLGIIFTTQLLLKTRAGGNAGFFRKNLWLPVLAYIFIFVVAVIPQISFSFLKPLQIEGMLLSTLILLAHGLVWDFMTDSKATEKTEPRPAQNKN